MRISVLSLHTSPAAQPGQGDAGGMNVYVDHTVRALAAAGHEVDVFTADPNGIGSIPAGSSAAVTETDGADRAPGTDRAAAGVTHSIRLSETIRLHHLHVDADSKDALAGRIDDLARLLADHPAFAAADLVWAHYWISAEAALRARSLTSRSGEDAADSDDATGRRPLLIASMHTIGAVKNRDSETEGEAPRRLRAEERIAAAVDLLIANTPAERRDLISELGADPAAVVVARPGVDHALFAPGESPGARDAARAALGLTADDHLVLYVGRMQYIKGTDVVVDALTRLQENNPELSARTRGILLGAASGWVEPTEASGGEASEDFHASLSAAIAAAPNIEVRAPVPAAELVDYYRAADVLLVPSRSESFGLVAAEAAASGLPAIAAAVGGLPEIVENGYSGLLIADHNPRHWALTLERLLGDEELRSEFAAHAAARSARFDWNLTASAVLDALAGDHRIAAHIGAGRMSGAGFAVRGASDLAAIGICGGRS